MRSGMLTFVSLCPYLRSAIQIQTYVDDSDLLVVIVQQSATVSFETLSAVLLGTSPVFTVIINETPIHLYQQGDSIFPTLVELGVSLTCLVLISSLQRLLEPT